MLLVRRPISLVTGIKPWQAGQWRYLRQQLRRHAPVSSPYADDLHIRAAATWLAAAQDATPDGGIPGRYMLGKGWTKAYPKTTGDLIPTFLNLAVRLGDDHFRHRAETCVRFLLPLQMACGAFSAGETNGKEASPSAFNTAQIISGLMAWHQATGDEASLEAAIKAANWLLSIQDADGAWRQYFFNNITSTHSAYLACWLAELGVLTENSAYLESARRNLAWVLSHLVPETGWIELAGYDREQQNAREALTHSIAYTLMGALRSARALGDKAAISRIRQSARPPARLLLNQKQLPAVLDWQWRARTPYACLTGNAQMAELWLTLHGMEPDADFREAARHALNIVKQTQSLDNPNPAIRGGIPGSNPIWGAYIFMGLPNWAAKFFVDAMLLLDQQKPATSTQRRGIDE